MMKKSNLKRSSLVKVLFILPVVFLFLGFLGVTDAQNDAVKGSIRFEDTGDPAYGVSVIIKGSTVGTLTDEDGKFELEVPGKREIVFSFVGYQTEIRECNPDDNIKIKLKPEIYEIEIGHMADAEDTRDLKRTKVKQDPGKEENFPETGEIFYVVEEMPQFPEGMEGLRKYIYTNLEYPEEANKLQKEGKVIVKFMVNTTGKVQNPVIDHSTNPIFNEAALEIIEDMPDWSPGKQRGKPVKVMFTVPVYFKLPKGN